MRGHYGTKAKRGTGPAFVPTPSATRGPVLILSHTLCFHYTTLPWESMLRIDIKTDIDR